MFLRNNLVRTKFQFTKFFHFNIFAYMNIYVYYIPDCVKSTRKYIEMKNFGKLKFCQVKM